MLHWMNTRIVEKMYFKITSKIPQYFENLDPPLICYQYKSPIRNIILNYNQVTSDPDVLMFIQPS